MCYFVELMKQFVKTFEREMLCFQHIGHISIAHSSQGFIRYFHWASNPQGYVRSKIKNVMTQIGKERMDMFLKCSI